MSTWRTHTFHPISQARRLTRHSRVPIDREAAARYGWHERASALCPSISYWQELALTCHTDEASDRVLRALEAGTLTRDALKLLDSDTGLRIYKSHIELCARIERLMEPKALMHQDGEQKASALRAIHQQARETLASLGKSAPEGALLEELLPAIHGFCPALEAISQALLFAEDAPLASSRERELILAWESTSGPRAPLLLLSLAARQSAQERWALNAIKAAGPGRGLRV